MASSHHNAQILATILGLLTVNTLRANEPGLLSVHFHEADFTRPDRVEKADQIKLDTGAEHSSYSRVWLGKLRMPATGEITFHAEADDGIALTIGGQEIIRGWHGAERLGRIAATAGAELPVEVRYFQNGDEAYCRLFWSWAGRARELVPRSAFSHSTDDLSRANALVAGQEKLSVPTFVPSLRPSTSHSPNAWTTGDWLMLDAQNVLAVDHLRRVVGDPVRHGKPMVDGIVDGNFQPYMSVVRDAQSGRWRMWYNVPKTKGNWGESSLALIESADGIQWQRPHRVLETPPIQFGASVIDEGPDFPEPTKRFKAAWHRDNGLQVAVSSDGEKWTLLAPGPVLRHNHDIDAIDWDPIRRRYMAFVSVATKLEPTWREARRIPHMSVSDDLIHWRQPWPIATPNADSPREQGETQFYCMAGVIERGGLLIGMVKVLRDDLNAEPGVTAAGLRDNRSHAGIGYTVLAWSADGERWQRDTEPFLDRNLVPGTWDRAHAWADEQVVHGDEVFIYYGGYQLGHKSERFTTRQIGLARMKIDRYAGFATHGSHAGTLRTPLRKWQARGITVNANLPGDLRVALCDPSGKFLPGFSFAECTPVRGDSTAHRLMWKSADPANVRGSDVQLVFQISDGAIYAFSLHP